jgi:radical SAM superfamily enzyme YgiQ (UPF0313 family)
MAEILLWNSMATRKRSPTDGFLENGLTTLKGFLEKYNHKVEIVDWQKSEFYEELCPKPLLFLNRKSTEFIFYLGKKEKISAKIYFPLFALIQEIVSFFQRRRMEKNLKKLGDRLIRSGVKVLGVKVWYGEAFLFSNFLARYIKKKDPSIITIAGGFHVTLYEEDFLKNSDFDFGVVSDGERPMKIILDIVDENIKNWDKERVMSQILESIGKKELKNIVYRKKNKIELTERYFPDMRDKSIPKYDPGTFDGKLKIHIILDAEGCPWGKCNFCTHSHFYPGYFPRPVKDIIKEIEIMVEQGVSLFKFAGSETPPQFGARIAKEVLDKKIKIKYTIGCRAIHNIGKSGEAYESIVKDFELMLRAGLMAIFMGGECANDEINKKVMNKEANREDILNTIKALRQAKKNTGKSAYVILAFIYPAPTIEGVTLKDIFEEDIEFIKKILPDSAIISPSTPFKNTNWYKEKKFGFNIPKDFITTMMKYEYVLYKPPSLWPPLGDISLGGMGFKTILEECSKLRKAVEDLGIPTDLSDEYFLMIEAAGYKGREGLLRFKKETSIDLASASYKNIKRMTRAVNNFNVASST